MVSFNSHWAPLSNDIKIISIYWFFIELWPKNRIFMAKSLILAITWTKINKSICFLYYSREWPQGCRMILNIWYFDFICGVKLTSNDWSGCRVWCPRRSPHPPWCSQTDVVHGLCDVMRGNVHGLKFFLIFKIFLKII